MLLAGLLVLIAILAAVPQRNSERREGELHPLGSPQHDYLRLQDELIAKP